MRAEHTRHLVYEAVNQILGQSNHLKGHAIIDAHLNAFYKEIEELEKLSSLTTELETNINSIWKEVNNAYYLGDMKARNFYNLIHEVAEIIKPNYEEIGKEFIE